MADLGTAHDCDRASWHGQSGQGESRGAGEGHVEEQLEVKPVGWRQVGSLREGRGFVRDSGREALESGLMMDGGLWEVLG